MTSLIGPRRLLLDTLEERYRKFPSVDTIPFIIYKYYWGEPGRFENHLGISLVPTEKYEATVPHVMFATPEALAYQYLGKRKALGEFQTYELPKWGKADKIRRLYD